MEERKCIHPRASVAKMFSEGGSSSNKGCIEEEGRRSKVSYMNEQCVIVYILISSMEGVFRQTSETINLLKWNWGCCESQTYTNYLFYISIVLPESM
jgi:hypothetical protein